MNINNKKTDVITKPNITLNNYGTINFTLNNYHLSNQVVIKKFSILLEEIAQKEGLCHKEKIEIQKTTEKLFNAIDCSDDENIKTCITKLSKYNGLLSKIKEFITNIASCNPEKIFDFFSSLKGYWGI